MKRRLLFFISVLTGVLLFSSLIFFERIPNRDGKDRLALVIGNGDYKEARLKNPVNDARDITRTLKNLGFEVIHRENADRMEMEEAVREFGKRLGRGGGTGLFYFAGHGIQVNGRNYLIPIGAKIETESDTEFETVDIGRAMGKMHDAGNALNIIILDACRSNPFTRGLIRGLTRGQGLAKMNASAGSIIAYATAPGSLAEDGTGRNGVYTKYLVKYMKTPGLTIEQVLKKTRIDVARETGNRQIPWEHSSLMENFYFASSSFGVDEQQSRPAAEASLKVECSVDGARVQVDGKYAGKTDLSDMKVSPGEHRILVEKEGYETYQRRINIKVGRHLSLFVELAPMPEKSAKARLFVNTDLSDASIQILNIRTRFHQGIELDPGEYHLEVSADGYETEKMWIITEAGEDRNLNVRLKAVVAARPAERGVANSIGMKFVLMPPGTFMMGSPPDEPGRHENERLHRVTLTGGFYMQTTEVTQGQWKAVMGNNPSHFKNCGNNCPVEKVSWNDVREFIKKLNRKEGTGKYRLPTEAEWEYAARAGTSTAYSWGDRADCGKMMYENDAGSSEDKCTDYVSGKGLTADSTAPVMSYASNSRGMYDMPGNVYEWCQDIYNADIYVYGENQTDPVYTVGSYRVIRGGGWNRNARRCRLADRSKSGPGSRSYNIGFRLARTP